MATIVNYRDVLLQASTRLITDNQLTMAEKPSWISLYASILAEQTAVGNQATQWGLTSQKTTYDNAITALTTYLGTLTVPVAWNNLTNITILSSGTGGGVTFRSKFNDVAVAKAAITNGVAIIPTTKSIVVTVSSQLFQISKAGVNSPASVTFTAQRENLPINPTWSITSGTGTLTAVSGDSATLTFANMTSDTVTVRALDSGGSGISDSITVVKVREGVDAVVGYLTNEAHTVPASDTGVVSSYTGANGTFKVYYGAADVTTSCTFSVLTNTSAVTTSIGASTGVYSVTAGIPNGTPIVTVTYRASYTSPLGNVYTIDKTFTVAKANAGTNGANGTNALLMSMSASSQVFQISKSNTVTPSSITFTAKRNNVTGANFTVTSGTATLTGVSGDNATLTYANLATDTATIRVADGTNTYADTITVIKVREGVDSLLGILTNDSVTVPASSSGVVSSYSSATGSFIVYYGSANVTTSCTFSVQSNPDSLATSIVGSGASAGQYNVTSGMSSVTNSNVTYRATYTNAFGTVFTVDKIFSLSKSNTGTAGSTGATGAQARIAYVKVSNGFVPNSGVNPPSNTRSGDVLPANGYWGTQLANWQTTPFTLASGESQFQSTGLFDTTLNQTVWVEPYLSNLKVGSLSALTVNTGTLTVDSAGHIKGGQTAYNTGTGFWLGYDSTAYKMSLGSSTAGFTWNGTAFNVVGNITASSLIDCSGYIRASGNYSDGITINGRNSIDNGIGVSGITDTTTNGIGVMGFSFGTLTGIGVYALHSGGGVALKAVTNTTGKAVYAISNSTSGYSGFFSGGKFAIDTATPIELSGSTGSTGQVLTSAGSSSTPTWGKRIFGGADTANGSGLLTVTVSFPDTTYGCSAIGTTGIYVVVTSKTTTSITFKAEDRATGAAVASAGISWTAIG